MRHKFFLALFLGVSLLGLTWLGLHFGQASKHREPFSEDIVRAERGHVSVHFPELISSREAMKYIKAEDVVYSAFHFEGLSGGFPFNASTKSIDEQMKDHLEMYIDNAKRTSDVFLANNAEHIAARNWEKIPFDVKDNFRRDVELLENLKKFDIDSPVFYNLVLDLSDEELQPLMKAHPEMRFSSSLRHLQPSQQVQRVINQNQAKKIREVSEDELHALILEEFQKSGLKP